MMRRYANIGSVRGWCGHYHRTISGMIDCLERDQRGCKSQGGYSDRRTVAVEVESTADLPSYPSGDILVDLTTDELDDMADIYESRDEWIKARGLRARVEEMIMAEEPGPKDYTCPTCGHVIKDGQCACEPTDADLENLHYYGIAPHE